ncbi:Bug family tripartite tricarboxylate transporter substrate binding protein [Roseomonas xinghualingensis]|uniref:Bug family tripartite tricarboxylate transporter substrate binding protein n=1 Tax=Roseomonas xinghualingensis TaxID=2986475 RepID=UPI0021F1D228|nr:tripartite tricarboxylate transporter substrate binding protein [Roseomonas sp. SXEYE001]MCV4208339.1 tripartite tricarboxylate transporter substrate binding protein [Roseomonas sp. SXEYE001]
MLRIALAVLALLVAPQAIAQTQPPIRLIVGFPPGGGIDLLSRVMGEGLAARLGRTVVVENRTGAGGNIATDAVAKATPDGNTLGAVPAGPLVINRHIYRSMPFDPLADFTPISRFAAIPVVFLAAPRSGITDIASLRATLEKGPLPCGTPGAGTTQHLAVSLLMRELRRQCTIVHYRGTGPALPDLLNGTIALYTDTVVTGLPPARDGRARAIAIASPTRSALAPEVPVVAESVPGFVAETWLALVAPRGLPEAQAARLEEAMIAMARDPAVVARLRELGAEAVGSTRAELAETIRGQDAMWGPVAKGAGVTAD